MGRSSLEPTEGALGNLRPAGEILGTQNPKCTKALGTAPSLASGSSRGTEAGFTPGESLALPVMLLRVADITLASAGPSGPRGHRETSHGRGGRFAKETEAYKYNLEGREPSIFIVFSGEEDEENDDAFHQDSSSWTKSFTAS